MNTRTALWVITILYFVLGIAAAAEPERAQKVHGRFPSQSLTGLWETETARALSTGEIDVTSPEATTPPPGGGLPPGVAELLRRNKLLSKPPYNAEWAHRAQDATKSTASPAHTAAECSSVGFPAMMENPFSDEGMFELLVTPRETLLLNAAGGARHIYTDGRKHPADQDLWPTLMGDSIGHWQRATLVIDTIAREVGPISRLAVGPAIPGIAELSKQARFTEHLHLIDADTLQDDMAIDDPSRFAHPWQITVRYKRVRDLDRLIAIDCVENDRNPIVNGEFTLRPP